MTDDPCRYVPTQGGHKGVRCLMPLGHPGGHIFEPGKLPAITDAGETSAFTVEEIAGALAEEEIRRRAEALDEAQGVWERAAHRARPKLPCPECTGNGQVFGGSLGDHCPSCHGTRVIDDDSVEVDFAMPDFKALRDPITAYGDALIARRYGQRVALPPASSVPELGTIEALRAQGRTQHKLLAGTAPAPAALPAAAASVRRGGFETDEGIEGTASDAELDVIEAEVVGESRGRR